MYQLHLLQMVKCLPLQKDENNNIHLVYGTGDSLMCTYSTDRGNSFSSPVLIDTLQGLVGGATGGPQITATKDGIAIIAVNNDGNIFSFIKDESGKWIRTVRVNDADTTDKEAFIGLSSDGENNLFAIWIDLRDDKHNKIHEQDQPMAAKHGIKIFWFIDLQIVLFVSAVNLLWQCRATMFM